MADNMLLEDGCLSAPPSSNFSAFNNIMIVKVTDPKSFKCTYELATLDRSIKGMEWPADKYISKLFPGLPEIQASDEEKAYKSRKILNLSLKGERPKHECPFIETSSFCKDKNFKRARLKQNKLARKKRHLNRSKTHNRFQSKFKSAEIQPWLLNPLDNELCMLPDGSVNLNVFPTTPSDGHFNLSNNYFHADSLNDDRLFPPHFNSTFSMLSVVPPPPSGRLQTFYPDYYKTDSLPNPDIVECRYNEKTVSNLYQYHYSFSRNTKDYGSRFGRNLSPHYKNNYARNARNKELGFKHDLFPVEPCNYYKKAKSDTSTNFMYEQNNSAHYYEPCNYYKKAESDTSTNFMYKQDNSFHYYDRGMPYISPSTLHENYIPNSRYEPRMCYENEYVEPKLYGSSECNLEMHRNNASYHIQYSRARNKKRRKNYKHFKQTQRFNSLKPRENANSFRRNANSFKLRRDSTSMQTVYNENQRKPWIVYKNRMDTELLF